METFPRYWPFVRGIHRSPVNSHHKGQWRGTLMFSLICADKRFNWVNNREAGDLGRHRAYYDVTGMLPWHIWHCSDVTWASLCLKSLDSLSNGLLRQASKKRYQLHITQNSSTYRNYDIIISVSIFHWNTSAALHICHCRVDFSGHMIAYPCWDLS